MAHADPPDEKPRYCQLRKGRWFWEPPLRMRKANGMAVKPLGADKVQAWAYARKLNKEHAGIDPDAAAPGTVTWLFEQFFVGSKFESLAPKTQKDYRWLAKRLGAVRMGQTVLGRVQARALRPRHADKLYELVTAESGHTTAHYACRFARRVWKWAGRREMVDPHPNPWAGMELAGVAKRHQRWTPEQVRAVRDAAVAAGWPSVGLAVHIAYCFTHRQGDVLALTWSALDDQAVETSKTGAMSPVVAAAYPELHAELEAERRRQKDSTVASTHVLVCETTKVPWLPDHFRHIFRDVAKMAGLPADIQFRDLRATGLTEMADADVSMIDMTTHSTHQTPQMARHYSRRTADQFQRAAAKRLANRKQT